MKTLSLVRLAPVGPPQPLYDYRRGVGLHDFEWPFKFYDDGGPNLPRVCNKDGTPKLKDGKPYGLPEVLKFKNGDRCKLIEPVERLWFALYRIHNPDLYGDELVKEWLDLTDDAKAFTNQKGSRTCRSFVAGTNASAEPMSKEGVDCPGGNIYRLAGDPIPKTGDLCWPIYCLDYDRLPSDYEGFAQELYPVRWLVHHAMVCRPERIDPTPTPLAPNGTFRCNPFSPPAVVPLMTQIGEPAVVDGFACRVNYVIASRVRELSPYEENPNPFVPAR